MLESFPDQLGKHMQIHELTRPRKITEASLAGAAGGTWELAKGIGRQMASQAITKATGMPDTRPAATSSGNRAATAGQYSQQQAQPFATQIQKAWTQMVQAQLQSSGAANLAQIDPADTEKLKTQLTTLVNQMITANSYSKATYDTLAANVAADNTEAQEKANIVSDTITKAVNDIWTATSTSKPENNAAATEKMFLTLAQNGILPAQNLLKFNPRSGTVSNNATAATASAPLTPGAKNLADALKIDMDSLPAAQAQAQANPDEAMQQFKELMDLK
jgi:hypothetical protein